MSTHGLSQSFASLSQLGWRPFFSRQLTLDELNDAFPARVAAVQRTQLTALAESGEHEVTLPADMRPPSLSAPAVTVGDWVLIERQTLRAVRLLERQSLIARLAAGTHAQVQSIAANVDTLFVVMSCNEDFNLSRLERYLAMAFAARVLPVTILTKADLCADVSARVDDVRGIAANVPVIPLNATNAEQAVAGLAPWLEEGQTIAFVGSSGVGKSTLINSLLGETVQSTAGIRESDGKGRHTTTSRHLWRTSSGVWLIDTPGMRELSIGAVTSGIEQAFADVQTLASQCRFRDCSHQQEASCAIRAAVADGRLDPRRLQNYLKLQREAERASQTPWERQQQKRQFGRMARAAQMRKRRDTGREEE